jgi:hypothetical protein
MRQTRRQIIKVAPEECNQASIWLETDRRRFIFASLEALKFVRALLIFLECIFPNCHYLGRETDRSPTSSAEVKSGGEEVYSVSIVTTLRAGRHRKQGSILGRSMRLHETAATVVGFCIMKGS